MNKTILLVALILIGAQGALFAQSDEKTSTEKRKQRSRSEETFNMWPEDVNIRDYVFLRSANVTLELTQVDDFNRLNNLDSILRRFRKDIAFYQDSLDKYPGNVRIDYSISDDYEFTQMRFKKYAPDGDLFVNKDGDISKLKLDLDTVRIIMHLRGAEVNLPYKVRKSGKGAAKVRPQVISENGKVRFRPQYIIQVTICMKSYKDIDEVIAQRQVLLQGIDTLRTTKRKGTLLNAHMNPSSSAYHPYVESPRRFTRFNGILKDGYQAPWNVSNRRDKIALTLNTGIGLLRNTLAPMGELGLSFLTSSGYRSPDYFTFVQASVTPYFLFDRSADKQFFIKDNWFVNVEVGSPGDILGLHTRLLTGGVGYLFIQKGDYFKGLTMKAFLSVKLKGAFTISPELIFTNDFKQIFPGITVKVF